MDVVGPLLKASGGQTHILVLLDYATCYPEAVALCCTTAPVIVQELATIFSCRRLPHQILSDQGTNFMNRVMTCLWQALGVQPL